MSALVASAPQARSWLPPRYPASTLVQVDAGDAAAASELQRAGGTLVSRSLGVWKVASPAVRELVPRLRASGALRLVQRDHRLVSMNHITSGDPLVAGEWWIPAVGLDKVEPPGPGVPLTVLDFGLDLTHAEFASRPNTVSLNRQRIETADDAHGTAVSSVAAAPANGVGLVGIYPTALLREWDFHDALLSDVIRGFDAASRTPGVINISGGFFGREPLLDRAVQRAFDRGSLVVAASGNDRQNGSRPIFPANYPHVLTVAATTEAGGPASFSSRGRFVDLAAPGQDMPVAVPTELNPVGYDVFDGTSFSAPLVAGAAAWVWTARGALDNTQLFDLMRFAARDISPAGRDRDTGYGLLDLPRALGAAIPRADPQEPNEDIYAVKPRGLSPGGNSPLTQPGRSRAIVHARLDSVEDPFDVYRIWLPAHRRLVVRTQGNHDVNLALWRSRTRSVTERGRALRRDRLAVSLRRGVRIDRVAVRNGTARGSYVYAQVSAGRGTTLAAYALTVATAGL